MKKQAKAATPKKARPATPNPGAKKSGTSTSTAVTSPTRTSTVADTKGNVTVTGGAGDGNTIVHIGAMPAAKAKPPKPSAVRSTTKNRKY